MNEKEMSSFEKWLQDTKEEAKESVSYRHVAGEATEKYLNDLVEAFKNEPIAGHVLFQTFPQGETEVVLYFTMSRSYRKDEFSGLVSSTAVSVSREVGEYVISEFLKRLSLTSLVESPVFEISRIHTEAEDNVLITTPRKYISMGIVGPDLSIAYADVTYDLTYLRFIGVNVESDFLDSDRFEKRETDEGTLYVSEKVGISYLMKDFQALGLEEYAPSYRLFQRYKKLKETLA